MSKVQSIEDLKQKCAEKNMPLEKMRFFIGEDRKEPKCFGVYQDERTGNWVVYKNKADGTRAVRYEGPDEARAAQEIWNKIGDEVKHRKDMHASPYDESVLREIYDQSGQTPSAGRGWPEEEFGVVAGEEAGGVTGKEPGGVTGKEFGVVPGREPEGASVKEPGESSGRVQRSVPSKVSSAPGKVSGRTSRSAPGKTSVSTSRRTSRKAPESILGGILGIFSNTFSFIWNEFVLEHPFASLFFALVGTSLFLEFVFPSPQNGYYQVEDTVYYYLEDQWYMYDDTGDWVTSYVDLDDPEDYYLGDFYSEEYGTEAFEGTEYYGHYLEEEREKENKCDDRDDDYDNDYDDDDYDYDYDDWDADDTDWDTDW